MPDPYEAPDLSEAADNVESLEDLIEFIRLLEVDFENLVEDGPYCCSWENTSLDMCLSAMERWITDVKNCKNSCYEEYLAAPSWKSFAYILLAAKFYE